MKSYIFKLKFLKFQGFLKTSKVIIPYNHQVSHKTVCKLLTKYNKIDQKWRMTFQN